MHYIELLKLCYKKGYASIVNTSPIDGTNLMSVFLTEAILLATGSMTAKEMVNLSTLKTNAVHLQ